jgi:bifunctional non-homologous end joining protein LigD
MEPVKTDHVVTDDGFIHQIKWDGVRGVAVVESAGVRVFGKSGRESTSQYPELGALRRQTDAVRAVIDGEIVAFADGKPSFYHVLKRSRSYGGQSASHWPVHYIAFDLLELNGRDLRRQPLEERQALLRTHFTPSSAAALSDDFTDGEALFALMKRENMEGIVSKRLGSVYVGGKGYHDWFKTKTARKMLCAVTGLRLNNGQPASLELAVYRDGGLVPVGHAGSGLNQEALRLLSDYAVKETTGMRGDVMRVMPRLTCWVRFAEWTADGTMRHPVLLGFSDRPVEEAAGVEISV